MENEYLIYIALHLLSIRNENKVRKRLTHLSYGHRSTSRKRLEVVSCLHREESGRVTGALGEFVKLQQF